MRATLFLIGAFGLILGGSVAAQDKPGVSQTRCFLGSLTFSAGAQANVGDGTAVCKGDSSWQKVQSDASAAGCILEGKLSSSGAIVGIDNNDQLSLQCDASGRWVTVANKGEEPK